MQRRRRWWAGRLSRCTRQSPLTSCRSLRGVSLQPLVLGTRGPRSSNTPGNGGPSSMRAESGRISLCSVVAQPSLRVRIGISSKWGRRKHARVWRPLIHSQRLVKVARLPVDRSCCQPWVACCACLVAAAIPAAEPTSGTLACVTKVAGVFVGQALGASSSVKSRGWPTGL